MFRKTDEISVNGVGRMEEIGSHLFVHTARRPVSSFVTKRAHLLIILVREVSVLQRQHAS